MSTATIFHSYLDAVSNYALAGKLDQTLPKYFSYQFMLRKESWDNKCFIEQIAITRLIEYW